MLGFAMRAGKLVIGTELVCRALAKGTVKLVLVSSGVSPSTKKKLTVKSEYYNVVSLVVDIDMQTLGKIIGKQSLVSSVAVTDVRFAEEIIKATEHSQNS